MATTHIEDSHVFPAPPEKSWDVLLDPVALKTALPACEVFEQTEGEQYRVTLAVNLIAFTATVSGDVTITNRVPYESYRVLVTGEGSLGSVNIECQMRLAPEGDAASRLTYVIDVDALGQLGVMAGPVLAPAAKMILGQFMSNMEQEISAREPHPAA